MLCVDTVQSESIQVLSPSSDFVMMQPYTEVKYIPFSLTNAHSVTHDVTAKRKPGSFWLTSWDLIPERKCTVVIGERQRNRREL